MITADTLRRCAWLSSIELEVLLQKNYPEDQVLQSNFLGVSNGGQFCYQIGYQDPDLAGQGLTYCKVFVWQENNGEIRADY
jgi:hypothetical protein